MDGHLSFDETNHPSLQNIHSKNGLKFRQMNNRRAIFRTIFPETNLQNLDHCFRQFLYTKSMLQKF